MFHILSDMFGFGAVFYGMVVTTVETFNWGLGPVRCKEQSTVLCILDI